MTEVKSIAKKSAVITAVLVASKVMGYLRELMVAAIFGATRESDILKTATAMPNVLFSCIAAALVTTFIPVFSNVKNDREEANKFFNNILNVVLLLCAILSIIGIAGSPILTRLFASGFQGADFQRTAQMTRIVMPSIIFLGISGLYTGYLQSYGIFLQPALTGLSADVVIILGILIFQRFGIMAAIVATLVSSAAQVLIQRPFMGEYKYRPYIDLRDKNIRRMLILAVPIVISTAVSQINLMVDRTFASRLVEGSISVVDNASKLSSIINQVFIVSITTVLYPMMTERYAQNDREGFSELFKKSINIILIVAVPLIFGMAVLSTPVIQILLEHGKFDRQATLVTSQCLKILAFGALGYSIMDICGKVFFSAKNTLTPMINGFILIGTNIILILILAPIFGVRGLAFATTISVSIISLLLLVEIKLMMKVSGYGRMVVVFLKTIVSGAAMALIVNEVFKYSGLVLAGESMILLLIRLLVAAVTGAFIYIGGLRLFKVEELNMVLTIKFRRK